MTRRAALIASLVLTVMAPAATAATAPGRVAFSVSSTPSEFYSGGDGHDVHGSVALPGGAIVILAEDRATRTALAVRLRPDGSRDPAFGGAGIAPITAAGAGFRAHHVTGLSDGRLLIAGSRQDGSPFGRLRLVIVRLLADGTPDPSFGAGGVVETSLGALVFSSPMALAPDGSIVLTGTLPRTPDPSSTTPTDWVLAKLGPDGAPDGAFGIVKIPVEGEASRPVGVAVTPEGSIVTLGMAGRGLTTDAVYLVGLTALGAPDPAFNGGAPVAVPLAGAWELHRRANGALDVLGSQAIVRFGAGGAIDTSYASGGAFRFAPNPEALPQLVALPGGGSLLVRQASQVYGRPLESRLAVQRLTAAGADAGAAALPTPFGGGFAFPGKRTKTTVEQNSFRGSLLRRGDGSFVATGRVRIDTPSGKMDGTAAEFVAAAAFTPRLAPDRSFGGPQRRPVVDVRVRRQRAVSSGRQRAIRLRVSASESGLLRLRVRDTRGRLLGGSLQPVYAPGAKTMLVGLTNLGARVLQTARRGLRIAVRHEFRDIVAGSDTGVTRGRLR